MSNNLTDILVQQFRKSFELSELGAQLVQTANFFGYFCMAIPAALVMRRWGYKAGMIIGLCLFGSGMVLFWPAAVSGKYVPFLIALFTVGCGASVLETAANPFMAQFGPVATSERRLNFAQSFNPPGTILGVAIGARYIFSGVEHKSAEVAAMKQAGTYAAYLHSEIMRVVPTYLALGSVVLLFALILSRMKFPAISSEHEGDAGDHGSFAALFHYPPDSWLAIGALFSTVGAQVSDWSSLIPYMKQYTNVSERTAAGYLTATLIVMAIGRFATTPLMKYVAASKLLGIYGAANALLVAVAITKPGLLGAYAIVASSFFLSIMFPTIFASRPEGFRPQHKTRRLATRHVDRRRSDLSAAPSALSPALPEASRSVILSRSSASPWSACMASSPLEPKPHNASNPIQPIILSAAACALCGPHARRIPRTAYIPMLLEPFRPVCRTVLRHSVSRNHILIELRTQLWRPLLRFKVYIGNSEAPSHIHPPTRNCPADSTESSPFTRHPFRNCAMQLRQIVPQVHPPGQYRAPCPAPLAHRQKSSHSP